MKELKNKQRVVVKFTELKNEKGVIVDIRDNGNLVGIEFDTHFSWMHSIGGKAKEGHGYWVDKGYVRVIEEDKEYPYEYTNSSGKIYKISSFSAKDLYLADFPKDEFIKFMKEWDYYGAHDFDEGIFKGYLKFSHFESLKGNLPWLKEHKFVKEIKKETFLKPGDVLVCEEYQIELIVTQDGRFYKGKGWREPRYRYYENTYETLEDFNHNSIYNWKIAKGEV